MKAEPREQVPIDRVLEAIAEGLVPALDAALVRVWLIGPGDSCATCALRLECPDRRRCLHLSASAGVTRRTDGAFRRFPIGARTVGAVARTREPFVATEPLDAMALAEPAWLATHRIRSFAAWPLVARDEMLGVLAVFSRRALEGDAVHLLGIGARHAALAIAEARALSDISAAHARLATENARLRQEASDVNARVDSRAGTGGGGAPAKASAMSPALAYAPADVLRPMADTERDVIARVLAHTGGRISGPHGAAAILGLKPSTLDSRIKKLGVRKPARGGRP